MIGEGRCKKGVSVSLPSTWMVSVLVACGKLDVAGLTLERGMHMAILGNLKSVIFVGYDKLYCGAEHLEGGRRLTMAGIKEFIKPRGESNLSVYLKST